MNILTVDIGGTFIKYAVMNEYMEFLSKGKISTPQEGREELIEILTELYGQAKEVAGIAISMPGIIDAENVQISKRR